MLHLRQARGGGTPDALGRGVGGAQVGETLLEVLQLAEQPVVLGVGDLRRVRFVVQPVCADDAGP